jgi:hypothetical protein
LSKTLITVTGKGIGTFQADAGRIRLHFTFTGLENEAAARASNAGFVDVLLDGLVAADGGLNHHPEVSAAYTVPDVHGGYRTAFFIHVDSFDLAATEMWLEDSGLLDPELVTVTAVAETWGLSAMSYDEAVLAARENAFAASQSVADDYVRSLDAKSVAVKHIVEYGVFTIAPATDDETLHGVPLATLIAEAPDVAVNVETGITFAVSS